MTAFADANYGGATLNEFTDANGHAWAVFYGVNYAAGYSGGWTAGSDIALMAVPEPGSGVMLMGGFGMLLAFQRMRKNRVGTR